MAVEIFIESDWDSAQAARAARDQRMEELQAQGFLCQSDSLCRIHDGCRLFLLQAEAPNKKAASNQRKRRGSTDEDSDRSFLDEPASRESPSVSHPKQKQPSRKRSETLQ